MLYGEHSHSIYRVRALVPRPPLEGQGSIEPATKYVPASARHRQPGLTNELVELERSSAYLHFRFNLLAIRQHLMRFAQVPD